MILQSQAREEGKASNRALRTIFARCRYKAGIRIVAIGESRFFVGARGKRQIREEERTMRGTMALAVV